MCLYVHACSLGGGGGGVIGSQGLFEGGGVGSSGCVSGRTDESLVSNRKPGFS